MPLTSKERFARLLRHQAVDRIGLFEVFWRETAERWSREGHFERPEAISDHFGLDVQRTGGEITPADYRTVNLIADVDAGETLLEETDATRLVQDGNGALLRWNKRSSGAPEHVGFLVQDRRDWDEHVRPRLLDETTYPRRVNFDAYRALKVHCEREQRFMTCGVLGAFDNMSSMCGHENLLVGMAADDAWVRGMADLYATLTVRLLELLFEREGLPDGLWVWDDLGYKHSPFMSPAMYREMIFPAHQKLFDFAHSHHLPVVLHCDGFVEPLLPALIEAGIDCLQPLEVKAGMDLLRIKQNFGARIALIGGMDARVLERNNLPAVDRELRAKLPGVMAGGGYVLQVDHSVSDRVDYATYRHFVDAGLAMGTYRT